MSYTGDFYVGMRGPGATITFDLTRPSAFSTSLVTATKTLLVEITQHDGTVATLSGFSWSSVTATTATASVIPDGTEFTSAGKASMAMSLTLDGTVYDLKSQTIVVKTIDLTA